MSAQPGNNQAPDLVNIEVDGKPVAVPKGAMIITAADRLGISIPRFCYHEKLPIAANCRMCLVDVEKAPKPMPACATPVMEGMKVYTQSKRALDSQRNVMEFLLINHPLDCPICDQGGECELQDVAMGYGRSVSRFVERKRVVADEDIGPLVATEMTRCIHCTRCVRFLGEIAGTNELGGMGRGERLEIGTYVGRAIETELAGNLVDVCPVGALTNKVFRFRARPWELIARESIGWHDALGSNLFAHTRRGEILRCVPRDNEAINECWLSDADRYSHQGLYAEDRAQTPMIRDGANWRAAGWDEALAVVAEGLRSAGSQIGALAQGFVSNEEFHLLGKLVRALGSENVDFRLRQRDFADHAAFAGAAGFEMPLAEVEKAGSVLLVGCDLRSEAPLLGHRVRKAAQRGARVVGINPYDFDFRFEQGLRLLGDEARMLEHLRALAKAAVSEGAVLPAALASRLEGTTVSDSHRAAFAAVKQSGAGVVILGHIAARHPQASELRALARVIADAAGAKLNMLPDSANALGAVRAGFVPPSSRKGLNAEQQLAAGLKAILLYQAETEDFAQPALAADALAAVPFVVAFGAYASESLKRVARVILPVGLPPEVEGSHVNVDGTVQTLRAGGKIPGEGRAGWKVLRALGNSLGVAGFGFTEFAEIAADCAGVLAPTPRYAGSSDVASASAAPASGMRLFAPLAAYSQDATLRRSSALQATLQASEARHVRLHPENALALGLSQDSAVVVEASGWKHSAKLRVDSRTPRDCVRIDRGPDTTAMPPSGSAVSLRKEEI